MSKSVYTVEVINFILPQNHHAHILAIMYLKYARPFFIQLFISSLAKEGYVFGRMGLSVCL